MYRPRVALTFTRVCYSLADMSEQRDLLVPTEADEWLTERGIVLESRANIGMFEVPNCRDDYIREFGFGVLTASTRYQLARYPTILEIGAGGGYWSWELRRVGAHVHCTDPHPYTCCGYGKQVREWLQPEALTAQEAWDRYGGPDVLVLSVWPSLDGAWLHELIRDNLDLQALAYVGEPADGCTADDNFFEYTAEHFQATAALNVPRWPYIHDYGEILRRRT